MVTAYLRQPDTIKPDYPNGLVSQIRENIILDAVSCDLKAEAYSQMASFHSAILPVLASKKDKEDHIQRCLEFITVTQYYKEYDHKRAKAAMAVEARKSAVEVYEILGKYDFWNSQPDFTPAQFREIIHRINELKQKERDKSEA